MKKFVFFFLTVIMVVSCMIVPAFAVNHNGNELPDPASVWTDKDKYPSACIYLAPDGYYQLVLSAGHFDGSNPSGLACSGLHAFYTLSEDGLSWSFGWEMDMPLDYSVGEYIWASEPVLDILGNVIFESPLAEDTAVLPTVVFGGSLAGVLGEVMSLLVWVIPAVVGLFGVRKGVAWLLARIRGA